MDDARAASARTCCAMALRSPGRAGPMWYRSERSSAGRVSAIQRRTGTMPIGTRCWPRSPASRPLNSHIACVPHRGGSTRTCRRPKGHVHDFARRVPLTWNSRSMSPAGSPWPSVPNRRRQNRADSSAGEGKESDPFRLLGCCLDDMVRVGTLDPGRRPNSDIAAWSAVHGLATLLNEGHLGHLGVEQRQAVIDRLLEIVEMGMR